MLDWESDDVFVLNDVAFRTVPASGKDSSEARNDVLVLAKQRWMVEKYVRLVSELRPRNILELGIFRGGSAAFLSLLAQPHRLVAIDRDENPPERFAAWLSRQGTDRVHAHYGVDQSDAAALLGIVAAEFDGELLDLVIDDASHLLGPSRASFDALFPCLRPGGIYVIEDWAARHVIEKEPRTDPGIQRFERELRAGVEAPLTLLLFEAVLAAAYTDVVDDISVQRNWVTLRRGTGAATPGEFRISECYMHSGRDLLNPRWIADGSDNQPHRV